jgi:hypothetical protein
MRRKRMFGVDLASDARASSRLLAANWQTTAIAVASGLVVWGFKHFGLGELALPLWSSIAALALTIATKWSVRRRAWFWIAMSAFATAHVLAFEYAVRWESWVSVKGFVLLALLDWLVMITTIGLVGKAMGERPIAHKSRQRTKLSTKKTRNSN